MTRKVLERTVWTFGQVLKINTSWREMFFSLSLRKSERRRKKVDERVIGSEKWWRKESKNHESRLDLKYTLHVRVMTGCWEKKEKERRRKKRKKDRKERSTEKKEGQKKRRKKMEVNVSNDENWSGGRNDKTVNFLFLLSFFLFFSLSYTNKVSFPLFHKK